MRHYKYWKIPKLTENKINKLLSEYYENEEYFNKSKHVKKQMLNKFNNNKINRLFYKK